MPLSARLAAAALLLATAATGAEEVPVLVIERTHVVPMTEERVVRDVSVLIQGGRIAGIAPAGRLDPPEGALIVDAGGAYLLPGLIEMHVHLRKRIDLDLLLGHGVTAARNMDGTPQVLAWRDAIARGDLVGPTLTSGSPFLHRHARDLPDRFVATPDDARRLVRRYAGEGYDYIKIAELDDAPFHALMEEARGAGIPVVGHIPNYDLDLARVFAERMHSVEHLEELYRVHFDSTPDATKIPAFVDLVRDSGVPISTLIGPEIVNNGLFEERAGYLTPERLAWVERYHGAGGVERIRGTVEAIERGDWERHPVDVDFLLRLVRELHAAGVVLLPGTDSGGAFQIAGHGLHAEMALYRRAGLTPFETLRSATAHAARVLGLGERKGTVEVGKDADLVLVAGNPLEDPARAKEPVGLVLGGRWLGADALVRLRGRTFADEP